MDTPDIYSVVFGDEESQADRARALAAALRQQRFNGDVYQATGAPILSKVGAGLSKDAEAQLGALMPHQLLETSHQRQTLAKGGIELRQEQADEAERNDKGSARSQFARGLAQQFMPGLELGPDTTAAQIERSLPLAEKAWAAQQAAATRAWMLGRPDLAVNPITGTVYDKHGGVGTGQNLHAPLPPGAMPGVGQPAPQTRPKLSRTAQPPAATPGGAPGGAGPAGTTTTAQGEPGLPTYLPGSRMAKQLDAMGQAFGKDMDAMRSTGEFGKNQQRVNAGKRVLQLVESGPDGYNINPSKMTEFSTAVASLIAAGGQPTETSIGHLTPDTVGGQMARFKEYWTNEPHGTNQQAFVKQMVDTANREIAQAAGTNDTARRQYLGKHAQYYKADKKQMYRQAQKYGITPAEVDAAFSDAGQVAGGAEPAAGRTVVRKQQNTKLHKTRITYSDGTTEEIDGLQ
jgi:hypothetical protein